MESDRLQIGRESDNVIQSTGDVVSDALVSYADMPDMRVALLGENSSNFLGGPSLGGCRPPTPRRRIRTTLMKILDIGPGPEVQLRSGRRERDRESALEADQRRGPRFRAKCGPGVFGQIVAEKQNSVVHWQL